MPPGHAETQRMLLHGQSWQSAFQPRARPLPVPSRAASRAPVPTRMRIMAMITDSGNMTFGERIRFPLSGGESAEDNRDWYPVEGLNDQ